MESQTCCHLSILDGDKLIESIKGAANSVVCRRPFKAAEISSPLLLISVPCTRTDQAESAAAAFASDLPRSAADERCP